MGNLYFVGDSITTGAWDERGGWANRLIADIMQLNIPARMDKRAFYCLPYNLGVSGDAVPNLLARLEQEVEARNEGEADKRYAEIIIYIGTNDAVYHLDENRPAFTEQQFETNFTELIHLATSLAGRVSVLGLLPVDDAKLNPVPWAPHLQCAQKFVKAFEDSIARVCGDNDIRFFPLFDRWLALPNWQELLIDGEHPNSDGHAMLAEQVRDFIINDDFRRFHS